MKHESKTWYSCDRCGKKVGEPKQEFLTKMFTSERYSAKLVMSDYKAFVDRCEYDYENSDNDALCLKYFFGRKQNENHLCRSCFKKYQKLLADFLKSEK